ncbi:MAG: hypothetical protein AAB224_06655 [Gemmatimonadota bacterium]
MISLFVVLSLQAVSTAATAPSVARDTATYQSPALREIITEAVRLNRRVPAGLGSYRAQMESEISIGSQRPDNGEQSVSVEQVASELAWNRTGAFEQRVTGYRLQSLGLQLASIGFFRDAWAVPSLYGNRLALLFGRDTTRRGSSRRRSRFDRSTVYAIHPLAEDRERVYRFRGGDTIQVLRVNEREIPIIRVDVEPKESAPNATVIFTGEIDLDASRRHIVRMRGYFARVGGPKPKFDLLSQARLQSIAFVELVNSEVEQAFWLPSYQRFEAQATAPFIGDARAVFRVVSRFRSYDITVPDGTMIAGEPAVADTLQWRKHLLSFAPGDSLRDFAAWHADMGALSSEVAATDFDDVAPDLWRVTGPPRTTVRPERVNDVIHVNRIEGIWTGLGITRQFRDEVPGLTMRAVAGYAWSERTVRGRAIAGYQRSRMRYGIRAGRSLDITNDFRIAFDSGSALSAIFGVDDDDYVDRSSVMLSAARLLPGRFGSAVRIDLGLADDRGASASMERGLLGRKEFRPNRNVLDGRYQRTVLTLDWRPDVNGELMRTGYGGRLYYERGDGDLKYQRLELRGATRWNRGRVTVAGRADAGQIFGKVIPPQQLFELGSSEALPGYGYKEFAGNRAALLRALMMYRLNVWTAPLRLPKRLWLPSPSPALAVGVQAGWTDVSTGAAQVAMAELGRVADSTSLALWRAVSRPSDGVRATVTGGVRFFGGAVGLLLVRPLDQGGKWRVALTLGQQL